MPFGLNKSGAVFLRMVRELLKGLQHVERFIGDRTVHAPESQREGLFDVVTTVLDQ